MAAKGQIAKTLVEQKLKEAFGTDYIGEYSKKYYVWADDGGEKVQIAISLTCPKNNVGEINIGNVAGRDFSGDNTVVAPVEAKPAEITKEEEENIADLIAALGL